jgi:hypothetical protein
LRQLLGDGAQVRQHGGVQRLDGSGDDVAVLGNVAAAGVGVPSFETLVARPLPPTVCEQAVTAAPPQQQPT